MCSLCEKCYTNKCYLLTLFWWWFDSLLVQLVVSQEMLLCMACTAVMCETVGYDCFLVSLNQPWHPILTSFISKLTHSFLPTGCFSVFFQQHSICVNWKQCCAWKPQVIRRFSDTRITLSGTNNHSIVEMTMITSPPSFDFCLHAIMHLTGYMTDIQYIFSWKCTENLMTILFKFKELHALVFLLLFDVALLLFSVFYSKSAHVHF